MSSLPFASIVRGVFVFPRYRAFQYSGGGWFAPYGRGTDCRGVLRSRLRLTRPCRLGGPRAPLLASPARYSRASPRWSGLWEIGVPLRGALLSATALHRSRGLFAFAPASVGLGACFALVVPPCGARSLRSLGSSGDTPSASRALPPSVRCVLASLVRAPASLCKACALLDVRCLGSPAYTVPTSSALRHSRSRPPRRSIYAGTLPATSTVESWRIDKNK